MTALNVYDDARVGLAKLAAGYWKSNIKADSAIVDEIANAIATAEHYTLPAAVDFETVTETCVRTKFVVPPIARPLTVDFQIVPHPVPEGIVCPTAGIRLVTPMQPGEVPALVKNLLDQGGKANSWARVVSAYMVDLPNAPAFWNIVPVCAYMPCGIPAMATAAAGRSGIAFVTGPLCGQLLQRLLAATGAEAASTAIQQDAGGIPHPWLWFETARSCSNTELTAPSPDVAGAVVLRDTGNPITGSGTVFLNSNGAPQWADACPSWGTVQ